MLLYIYDLLLEIEKYTNSSLLFVNWNLIIAKLCKLRKGAVHKPSIEYLPSRVTQSV